MGDYLIPNLISALEPEGELRKFRLMRIVCLKEYRDGFYHGIVLLDNSKCKNTYTGCENPEIWILGLINRICGFSAKYFLCTFLLYIVHCKC